MKAINGRPRFDTLALKEVRAARGMAGLTVQAEYVFLHRKTGTDFGSKILDSQHVSKESTELFEKLVTSLENDAASHFFHQQPQEEQGGISDEPQGIADEEPDDQQL